MRPPLQCIGAFHVVYFGLELFCSKKCFLITWNNEWTNVTLIYQCSPINSLVRFLGRNYRRRNFRRKDFSPYGNFAVRNFYRMELSSYGNVTVRIFHRIASTEGFHGVFKLHRIIFSQAKQSHWSRDRLKIWTHLKKTSLPLFGLVLHCLLWLLVLCRVLLHWLLN